MKKALILHAWYSKPEDNWYPWLKEKMEEKGGHFATGEKTKRIIQLLPLI